MTGTAMESASMEKDGVGVGGRRMLDTQRQPARLRGTTNYEQSEK
jgi:hypothetical protein